MDKKPATTSVGVMMISGSSLRSVNSWVHVTCGVLAPPGNEPLSEGNTFSPSYLTICLEMHTCLSPCPHASSRSAQGIHLLS